MKKLVICLLLLASATAQAQYYEAATIGAGLAASAFKKKPQDPTQYVTTTTYKGKPVSQKRTPPDKLKGKAATEIAQVEAALAACSANLLVNDLQPICTDQQYFALQSAIKHLSWTEPTWSTSAYDAENDFYRSQEYWRTQQREQATRQRRQRASDSLQQVRLVAARHTDSLRLATSRRQQATADSTRRVAQRAQALASPYRYINAPQLIMRVSPAATAKKWATIGGGSTITLVQAGPEWSKVKASERTGYVQSKYLVVTADEVAPAYVDQEMVRLTGRQYSSVSWEEDAPAPPARRTPAARPKPAAAARHVAVASGPAAYYCASGNVVKYHSSETCRGLARCGANVVRISLRQAGQTMDPCKFCH